MKRDNEGNLPPMLETPPTAASDRVGAHASSATRSRLGDETHEPLHESPAAAASSGLPDEPKLWSPILVDNTGVRPYAMMQPSVLGGWVQKCDYDAHAATLSRELAAKDGEIARLSEFTTTGPFAPGIKFKIPKPDEIHDAQLNARPNHGKTIRHLAAWAGQLKRDNEAAEQQLAEQAARVVALTAALRPFVDSDCGRLWVWPITAKETAMKNAHAALKGSTP